MMLKQKVGSILKTIGAFIFLFGLCSTPAVAVDDSLYEAMVQRTEKAWENFYEKGVISSQDFWNIGMESFLSVSPDYFSNDKITLRINGDKVLTDPEQIGEPYINKNDRLMIPLRMVNGYMGFSIDWQADGSIYIHGENLIVQMQLESNEVMVNGEACFFDEVPVLKNNRTYIPVRDFAMLYGSIIWDNEDRCVNIFPEKNYDTIYRVTENGVVRNDGDHETLLTLSAPYDNNDIDEVIAQKRIDGVTYLQVGMGGDDILRNVYAVFRDNGEELEYVLPLGCDSPYFIDGDTIYYTEGQYSGPWTLLIKSNRLYVSGGEEIGVYDLCYSVNCCVITMKNGVLGAITPELEFKPFKLSELDPIPWPEYLIK